MSFFNPDSSSSGAEIMLLYIVLMIAVIGCVIAILYLVDKISCFVSFFRKGNYKQKAVNPFKDNKSVR